MDQLGKETKEEESQQKLNNHPQLQGDRPSFYLIDVLRGFRILACFFMSSLTRL
jgi:hypothetical protein